MDIIKPDGTELDEEKEEKEGGFIAVNADDDNENGKPDIGDNKPVKGENDLIGLKMALQPKGVKGKVRLKASQ